MSFAIVAFSPLNNVRFVTSTFSKTETLTISLMFAMNVMVLPYVLRFHYSLADLKIVTIKKGTYRVISNIWYIEITGLLETSDLNEKDIFEKLFDSS